MSPTGIDRSQQMSREKYGRPRTPLYLPEMFGKKTL